jgi:hypothetical protein
VPWIRVSVTHLGVQLGGGSQQLAVADSATVLLLKAPFKLVFRESSTSNPDPPTT